MHRLHAGPAVMSNICTQQCRTGKPLFSACWVPFPEILWFLTVLFSCLAFLMNLSCPPTRLSTAWHWHMAAASLLAALLMVLSR